MITDESIDGRGRNNPVATFRHSDIDRQLEKLLTIEDVSAILKVPKSWIYEHTRKRGSERLPHIKLGKYLRFEEQSVISYLTRHQKNSYNIRSNNT